MKPILYYLGQAGDGFGWGVANTNIRSALLEFCDLRSAPPGQTRFDGPVFVPVVNSRLEPWRKVRAPRVIGYCFTEYPIGDKARQNARLYDVLFAGSLWNVQRLAEHGIKAEVLHQGIDFERFKVQPPSERKGFVVFSGGKFEFRKGQDYVITAMRHFLHVREDAVLLAAWHNPWVESRATMRHSWLLEDWKDPCKGLPKDRVILLPALKNEQTPPVYAMAHLGLFPNRCEAGTNLVMSEFMACGRPVIATAQTGHADVFHGANGSGPILLNTVAYDPAGWANPPVSDIISALDYAYRHREELPSRGAECRQLVERFTWRECARRIAEAAAA